LFNVQWEIFQTYSEREQHKQYHKTIHEGEMRNMTTRSRTIYFRWESMKSWGCVRWLSGSSPGNSHQYHIFKNYKSFEYFKY